MKDSEIHTAVLKWVKSITGIECIKGMQDGPRPDLPYCMLNLTGTAEVREHAQGVTFEDVGEDVKATLVHEVEWRFSLHAYGAEPTDILRPLRAAADLMADPIVSSVVIHDFSQVRNLPEFINEAWEPRAQMDINVRGLTRDGFVVDTVEQHSFVFEQA